jgi:predicted RNA binding protein YcfA (HicA-like mRNA interferase family)
MAKKYSDVRRALRAAGWDRLRTTGSHEVWTHPEHGLVVIPGGGKNNLEVPPGTLASIRKRTGLRDLR